MACQPLTVLPTEDSILLTSTLQTAQGLLKDLGESLAERPFLFSSLLSFAVPAFLVLAKYQTCAHAREQGMREAGVLYDAQYLALSSGVRCLGG